jgi:hypothetical protein
MVSALQATRAWVESVVIELELCPFARAVFDAGQIRFAQSAAAEPETLLADLDGELARLLRTPVARLDTTLLVHPHALADFEDYNDFLDSADALLHERGCRGVVQIASFHPDYCFAGSEPDDPANWSNRSPHPMLHLLREQSVSDALATVSDPAAIPERNVERLRSIGAEAMVERLARCCSNER